MKKTKTPRAVDGSALQDEIKAKAKLILEDEWAQNLSSKCSICGGDSAPTSTEDLCWVCRRLKISAWRDSDNPVAMQE